jgi:hypothetical protein
MTSDPLIAHYAELIDTHYDCIDRIVLNAYNYPIQSGGGFRLWWRDLHGGEEKLDNTHLMRYAGRFSRRVRAYAEAHDIPLIDCRGKHRKHEFSDDYIPIDPSDDDVGLFCILVGRAPAPAREVIRCSNGQPHIQTKKPYPYVNWYAFHIMDREWGHLIIRFCPHPPFNAMIILNGHEYVARRAAREGIGFTKEGNCFTNISSADDLGQVADAMAAACGEGRLAQVCDRWIYSTCLCFALKTDEQRRTDFRYGYSVYQLEYSRNLLFTRGRVLDQVFDGIIDRTRSRLDIKTVRTLFGHKRRPYHRSRAPRFEVVVEKPAYNLTVFKVHFKRLTLKIYSKGERVLRIEAIAHNTRDLRGRRGVDSMGGLVAELRGMLERFTATLHCAHVSFIDTGTMERWPERESFNGRAVAGLDVNRRRVRAAMEAVLALSLRPTGFTAAEHAGKVREIMSLNADEYRSRQSAYDLKKLRAKGLVEKLDGTRRYEASEDGLRSMCGFITLREKVLKPLLANPGEMKPGHGEMNHTEIDTQYEAIQTQMKKLFEIIGFAA